MPNDLPPALDQLRDELREAARRDIEVESRVAHRMRHGRLRRWLLVATAAIVSVGGVAVAQRALDRERPAHPAESVPSEARQTADPGIVTSSATADPSGGPPWALRVFTNPAGLDCVTLGRLSGARLGTYENRTFRPLPARVAGACGPLAESGLLVAVQQRARPFPRTIVYGLARDRQPVRITVAGTTRTLRPGGLGSFIDLRVGVADLRGATATTKAGGRVVSQPVG